MVYVTRLPPSTPLAISCIWPLRVPISSTTYARSLSLFTLIQPYPIPNPKFYHPPLQFGHTRFSLSRTHSLDYSCPQ